MTNVDDFVRELILQSPGLFGNRTEVLHFALCVLGNGFQWENDGTIVPIEALHWTPSTDEPPEKSFDEETFKAFAGTGLEESLRANFNKRQEVKRTIVAEIDERVNLRAPLEHPYPQSSYALLMNIPENVQDEWRDACVEITLLMLDKGWEF